jgi:hypothetical protein
VKECRNFLLVSSFAEVASASGTFPADACGNPQGAWQRVLVEAACMIHLGRTFHVSADGGVQSTCVVIKMGLEASLQILVEVVMGLLLFFGPMYV